MRLLIVFLLALCWTAPAVALEPEDASSATAASTTSPTPAPKWYLDDIEFLTRDGGRWVASNAEFQSEDEPMEAYVLEWKKDYANSMTGRLYGTVNGEPTGDFWRFTQYWHPGLGAAQLQQFGFGGAAGIGVLWQDGDITKTKQIFYAPDGSAAEQGHGAHNPDADTHVTTSFDIVGEEWKTRRSYIWKRDKTVSND